MNAPMGPPTPAVKSDAPIQQAREHLLYEIGNYALAAKSADSVNRGNADEAWHVVKQALDAYTIAVQQSHASQIQVLRAFVPQQWGEALLKWPWLLSKCPGHEWDNRTTAENAIWLIGLLEQAEAQIQVLQKEKDEFMRAPTTDPRGDDRTGLTLCAEVERIHAALPSDWYVEAKPASGEDEARIYSYGGSWGVCKPTSGRWNGEARRAFSNTLVSLRSLLPAIIAGLKIGSGSVSTAKQADTPGRSAAQGSSSHADTISHLEAQITELDLKLIMHERALGVELERTAKQAAQIVTLEQSRRWLPMETAPKDGTDVLVCSICQESPEPYVFIASYVKFDGDPPEGYHDGWCNHWDGAYLPEDEYELTHWMPLPPPPTSPEAQG